ncbi:unnamed protein product [Cunninghamella echinulata]
MSQNVATPSKFILNKIYQKSDSIHSHICSFHVHYNAWSTISKQVHNNIPIDPMNPELSTCPFFNFTFCVAFRMTNNFKKLSPPVPKCFCNLRVVISKMNLKENDVLVLLVLIFISMVLNLNVAGFYGRKN